MKERKNNPENDNPMQLYTMPQAAKYCKRSIGIFRKYYGQGMLPDPMNTVVHKNKKTRLFTLQECKNLREHFRTMGYGKMAKRRKRNA